MLTLIYYELLQLFRSKQTWLTLFLLPIALIFILGSALANDFMGENKQIQDATLAVFIEEGSPVENPLREFLAQENVPLAPQYMDSMQDIQDAIQSRAADFGLVVPAGIATRDDGVDQLEITTLLGKSDIQNLVAQAALQPFIDGVNVASTIQYLGQKASSEGTAVNPVAHASSGGSHIVENSVKTDLGEYRAVEYYTAAMMVMFLMYSGMTAGTSMLTERANHTLSRLQSLPIRNGAIVAGKIGATLVITAIQVAVVLSVSFIFYKIDFGGQWHQVALLCLLMCLFTMALAVLLSLLAKTSKGLQSIFHAIIVFMTFVSGGFIAGVGGIITDIAKFTPSYWAKDGMLELVLQGPDADLGVHYGLLSLMAFLLVAVTVVVYRKEGSR